MKSDSVQTTWQSRPAAPASTARRQASERVSSGPICSAKMLCGLRKQVLTTKAPFGSENKSFFVSLSRIKAWRIRLDEGRWPSGN